MYRFFIIGLLLLCFFVRGSAQHIEKLPFTSNEHYRGLCVVNDSILWLSGTHGSVVKSTNGGKSFAYITVAGFEKTDFRDIEAFDDKTAIIMGVDSPGIILKTIDGGLIWKVVFTDTTKGVFLDALDFFDLKNGFCVGDPIHNSYYFLQTKDGGNTWKYVSDLSIKPDSGEAFFAASGTNIIATDKNSFVAVSGGAGSFIITNFSKTKLPFPEKNASTGANGIAGSKQRWIVVGGDYTKAKDTNYTAFYYSKKEKKWQKPITSPTGYRSCVIQVKPNVWLTCGLNGVDISLDNGVHYRNITTTGYHTCAQAKKGSSIYLCGFRGNVGKLIP